MSSGSAAQTSGPCPPPPRWSNVRDQSRYSSPVEGGRLVGDASGAASTAWHAGGIFAMVSGGLGLVIGDGLGCSTASVNHQSKSLPQPSPGGGGDCGLHSGLSV